MAWHERCESGGGFGGGKEKTWNIRRVIAFYVGETVVSRVRQRCEHGGM